MTPHNRVLLVVGGAALIAIVATAVLYLDTNAALVKLQTDGAAADQVQTLGDELLVEVHEQHEALGDYLLSPGPRPLSRYRQAVTNENQLARQIRTDAANLSGVAVALAGVVAENDRWRATVADPAIAAVQSGSIGAINAAIRIQTEDEETSQPATRRFIIQLDAVETELGLRFDALNRLRAAATTLALAVEILAAALSLWFVRRYGLTVSRDVRRRARVAAERLEVIASLRILRTQETPEATAAVIAKALRCLPGVDVAGVLECTPDGLIVLAIDGPRGFPLHSGEALSESFGRFFRERSVDGPWAERWIRPSDPNVIEARMAALGIKTQAFAPIQVDGEVIGLIGLATTDEVHASNMIEDLPPVGEFASVAETILGPALVARQRRTRERRRMAATIAGAAFRPVFQPIVDLSTGRTVGFEALTRFDDGSPPDLTFAAARNCGMGIELEMVTLEAALREAHNLTPGVWLSLNVSPALLAKGGGTLGRMLADWTGPVVLEVTEHDAIEAYGPLREAMLRLGPGVRLAVDDAGAGVANFNHMVELRPNFVKIDAGLVRGVHADLSRQAVVVGLIHFAAKAGCEVIAEGIETEAERATVMALGVTLGQGYLLARPAPAETWNVAHEPEDAHEPAHDVRDGRKPRADRPARAMPSLGPLSGGMH